MSAVTSENQSARDASAVASSSLSPPLSVDRRPSAVISSDSQGISIELSVSPPSSSSGSILRRVLPPSNPSEISSNNPSSVTSIAPLSSEQVLLENPNVPGEFSVLSATKGNSVSSISTMELHPVIKSFIVGSVSGTCSTVIFQPLDLLKTRLQSPVGRSNGMLAVVGHIVRDEKVLGLWRGMTPSLTRCVPGVGLYFGSIHGLKIFLNIESEPTAIQSIILGATARSISGVTMIPFTVIKTRFESKFYQYGSIREALALIYKNEGVRGLTCGLLPTLLRDAPFSALYLMMYTWAKKAVPHEWMDSGPFVPYVRFSCGVVAGVGASLVTQPFDVIKTKMQLFPQQFQSIPPVIVYVYQKYGMRGYFKGLMPRMVRRTLIAAMSWTVYEQLMRSMGLK